MTADTATVLGDYRTDTRACSDYWQLLDEQLARLPPKASRNANEIAVVTRILSAARLTREAFLEAHVDALYDRLTDDTSRFVSVKELVLAAAGLVPGLVPTAEQLAAEDVLLQSEKEGREVDQSLFISHVLGSERAGRHLCHAMLLPRPETDELLPKLARDGRIDLGAASVELRGKAAILTLSNPRYLNAEDQTTIEATQIAVDLATLDPSTEIAVLRGGPVEHPKYEGRRILGSGINLTHLYRGQIPFIWFMDRELGFVHKFLRGVAEPDSFPDDVHGFANEKPWLAAVDTFAIGGHCQILLTMDYVLAGADAFMTLPARKEGIIPGASNLRLPRFVGDRLARQLIQYERRLEADSPEGRLICDEVVPLGEMDSAIDRVVQGLTSSGAVSVVGNRRAFRVHQEPIDAFRRYCAVYAREQAVCHFSPALIANLERHWDARNRKG